MPLHDVVIVGAGPNGLAAGIELQRNGLSSLILEKSSTEGGGTRSVISPAGVVHDVCSAIHPLGVCSPFFKSLPLQEHGLRWIYSEHNMAHPLDGKEEALFSRSVEITAASLGRDDKAYRKLIEPLVDMWDQIDQDVLGPLSVPSHPLLMARFGLKALLPATRLCGTFFSDKLAKALFAGMAAHSMMPLSNISTAAMALVLSIAGHKAGWPVAAGGSQSIAKALSSYYRSLGGEIRTDAMVRSLKDIPPCKAIIFDLCPAQILSIAGEKLSALYRYQLSRFRYGPGVFKINFEVSRPVPFTAPGCHKAATVHIGGTYEEIAEAEYKVSKGKIPPKPFIILAQQSLFDKERTGSGLHNVWAYTHVPNGSVYDMTELMEKQIERFAPGFRAAIVNRTAMNSLDYEKYNPNYVGGDINAGQQNITQLFTRPVYSLSPYTLKAGSIYIASSSSPPGGGVHGMCGYHAARRVVKDLGGRKG